jgi:polyphosphate kinase
MTDPARTTSESAARERQADAADLRSRQNFFNRELSWMDFNDRVLQRAEQEDIPLLERLAFLSIVSSNFDEFVMIRVAGLHDLIDAGIEKRTADGLTPDEAVDGIRSLAVDQINRQSRLLREELLPQLAEAGIRVCRVEELTDEQRAELSLIFESQIFPVLTPLAVGPGRPFPYISNLSLSLAVLLRDRQMQTTTFARVKVPKEILPRFVTLGELLVPLEDVIADNLQMLFPGTEVVGHAPFRVTRDADFTVSDEADDLLLAVEDELRRRRFGEVVRVEIGAGMAPQMRQELVDSLEVDERDVFEVDGLLDLVDLRELVARPGYDELRFEKFSPVVPAKLRDADGEQLPILPVMRDGDFLVHHPYESFSASVERFVAEAVNDPDVLAIKLTVYRTSDDSPLVTSLIRATERGKQAVALVELKARFDEQANIAWARELEQSGVHVVYGPPALKVHTKCVLVVRREGDRVRNYVHIGTGNYNSTTARSYTDFGLFTTDPQIGADVADMFNYLTGFARPTKMRKVLIAPTQMRGGILEEIERTIAAHEDGLPSKIKLKMNALVDVACIEALYTASRAGVKIELAVRGVCCLRPGVPGVSENITVRSVVGRFLEHDRAYCFIRGDERRVLIGSADLMRRNLDNRVELVTPIERPDLQEELLESFDRGFADNSNSWELTPDDGWQRRVALSEAERRDVQQELIERFRSIDSAFGS